MMDQSEKVFGRLKSGEDWDNILKDSGKSSVYKGVTLFFNWVGPQIKTLQTSIKTNEDKIANQNSKITQLDTEIDSKEAANTKLEEKQQLIMKKNEELSSQVDSTQKRLEELESGLTKLGEKGISREVIEAITTSDISSPDELIKRVDTENKYESEKSKHEELKSANLQLENTNASLAKQQTALRAGVTYEQNSLDQAKRETTTFRNAQTVVIEAFGRGYSTENLIDLLKGLQQFELKKQPNLSVNRLLSKLGTVKMTEEREERNRALDAEYAQTKKNLGEARGQVAAIQNSYIPTLNGSLASAKNEIMAYRKAAISDFEALANSHSQTLNNLQADAEDKLAKINRLASAQASYTNEQMGTQYILLSNAFKIFHGEVIKWGQVKEEMGQKAAILRTGAYFQALGGNPSLAADMPASIVTQLSVWLSVWAKKKLPEAVTLPPPYLTQIESSLPRVFGVRFTSLTEWVRHDVADRLRRGEIK